MCNKRLMRTKFLQSTFPVLKAIRCKSFLTMAFCVKHTAWKGKCFINAWIIFQPFKLSILLSAKMTTLIIDNTLVDMVHVLHEM